MYEPDQFALTQALSVAPPEYITEVSIAQAPDRHKVACKWLDQIWPVGWLLFEMFEDRIEYGDLWLQEAIQHTGIPTGLIKGLYPLSRDLGIRYWVVPEYNQAGFNTWTKRGFQTTTEFESKHEEYPALYVDLEDEDSPIHEVLDGD
jgi:GNAT superfamily N-acetyltransferase